MYQYATGFAAATAIKELVLKDSKNAEKYMSFLSSGDSDYPLEVLKRAGVDLTCGDAARAVVRDMKNAICEIEK